MKEMIGGCCICAKETAPQENPIVYCDGENCSVAVHRVCYGIESVPQGDWFCRPCEAKEVNPVCELCPLRYGALKRTKNGKWAHLLCALHIPEVDFGNIYRYEPIILDKIPPDRYQNVCVICERYGRDLFSKVGAMVICSYFDCKNYFHATCAQLEGLLCEKAYAKESTEKAYLAFCYNHIDKKRKGVCQLQVFTPVNLDEIFLKASSNPNAINYNRMPPRVNNTSNSSVALFNRKDSGGGGQKNNLNLSATSSSSNESIDKTGGGKKKTTDGPGTSSSNNNNHNNKKKQRSKTKSNDLKDSNNSHKNSAKSDQQQNSIQQTSLLQQQGNNNPNTVAVHPKGNSFAQHRHHKKDGMDSSRSSQDSDDSDDSGSSSSSSYDGSSSSASSRSQSCCSGCSNASDSEHGKHSAASSGSSRSSSQSSTDSDSSDHSSSKEDSTVEAVPAPPTTTTSRVTSPPTTTTKVKNKKAVKQDNGAVSNVKMTSRRESNKSSKKSPAFVDSSSSDSEDESQPKTSSTNQRKKTNGTSSNNNNNNKPTTKRANNRKKPNKSEKAPETLPESQPKVEASKTRRKSSTTSTTAASSTETEKTPTLEGKTSVATKKTSARKRQRQTSSEKEAVTASTTPEPNCTSEQAKMANGNIALDALKALSASVYPVLTQNISPQLERLRIDVQGNGEMGWMSQTNRTQLNYPQTVDMGNKGDGGGKTMVDVNTNISSAPMSSQPCYSMFNGGGAGGGNGTVDVCLAPAQLTTTSTFSMAPNNATTNNFLLNIVSPNENSNLLISPPTKATTVVDSNNIASMVDSNGLPLLPSHLERPATPKTIEDFLESQWIGTCQFLLEMEENRDIAAIIRDYNQLVKKNIKLKNEIQEANQKFNYFLQCNKEIGGLLNSKVDVAKFIKPPEGVTATASSAARLEHDNKTQQAATSIAHNNNNSVPGASVGGGGGANNSNFGPINNNSNNNISPNIPMASSTNLSMNDLKDCSNLEAPFLGNNSFMPTSSMPTPSDRLESQQQRPPPPPPESYGHLNGVSIRRPYRTMPNDNYPPYDSRALNSFEKRGPNGTMPLSPDSLGALPPPPGNNNNNSNPSSGGQPFSNYGQQQQPAAPTSQSNHFGRGIPSAQPTTNQGHPQTNGRLTRSNASLAQAHAAAATAAAAAVSFINGGGGAGGAGDNGLFPASPANNLFPGLSMASYPQPPPPSHHHQQQQHYHHHQQQHPMQTFNNTNMSHQRPQ